MTLENLLKIRQLDEHTTDAADQLLEHVKAWLVENRPELIA